MSRRILLSGGFDPLTIGHVRMMKAAEAYGEVVVALNSDEWLMRKKGYVFMPWEERAEIIGALGCVSHVVWMDDGDDTACDAIMLVRPDYFGNGGDRTETNTPEKVLCDQRGIQMVWNLGGGKIQSSSNLVEKAAEKIAKEEKAEKKVVELERL